MENKNSLPGREELTVMALTPLLVAYWFIILTHNYFVLLRIDLIITNRSLAGYLLLIIQFINFLEAYYP